MKLSNQTAIIRQLGLRTWLQIKIWPVVMKLLGNGQPGRFTLPGCPHPLFLRPHSSDLYVFHQIFVEREYACLDDLADPGLILDCGANVGYSSAYFLSRFPRCRLVAVEPDPDNFEMLRRNLAGFGDRARVVQAGVWSHAAPLKISHSTYRDGLDWSTQVLECGPGEVPDVQAVDLGTLLAESGRERISLLKMDIEGAEAVVFAANYQAWIDRVDHIAIEIHDDTSFGPASGGVMKVLTENGFTMSRSGELTICRRTRA